MYNIYSYTYGKNIDIICVSESLPLSTRQLILLSSEAQKLQIWPPSHMHWLREDARKKTKQVQDCLAFLHLL